MLKQRILTALILVPLVVWAIISLPDDYYAAILALIVVIGCREWTVMARLTTPLNFVYLVLFVVVLYASWVLINTDTRYVVYILYAGCVWWVLAFALLARYNNGHTHVIYHPVIRSLIGLLILVPTFVALYWLRSGTDAGYSLVLYLLILIWLADSAAYFTGKKFGKHKLLPNVSPGKTWQGVFGAFAASIIFSIVYAFVADAIATSQVMMFVAISFITVIFSIHGDLTESMFKRQVNIKDSGQLLPGHGGMLDRIDSLTAAAPVFSAGLIWMSHQL